MKKMIALFSLVAGLTVGATSAHAWVCTAQAQDGAYGEAVSMYLPSAQVGAMNFCRASSALPWTCILTSCF